MTVLDVFFRMHQEAFPQWSYCTSVPQQGCDVAQVVLQIQWFSVWKNYKQLTTEMTMRDQTT